ncbi:MAG: cell division protein FtsZ [Pontibacterium sp.]
MFEVIDNHTSAGVIKVLGVGGAGNNSIRHMLNTPVQNVEYIAVNTDVQALRMVAGAQQLDIGARLTRGLGAGAKPQVGYEAALEDKQRLIEAIGDADMVFITAGMGGGTGTGAAPVIAELAKAKGILTVGVVTTPFPHEGRKRQKVADCGLKAMADVCDSLVVVPNGNLISALGKNATLTKAFAEADKVLSQAVEGISSLIVNHGFINVDFADVCTVMRDSGSAVMGIGEASGEGRVQKALDAALRSPLLGNADITNATGVLLNIAGEEGLTIDEFNQAGEIVYGVTCEDAEIVTGLSIDNELNDRVRVTVIATGVAFDDQHVSHENDLVKGHEPSSKNGQNAVAHDAGAKSKNTLDEFSQTAASVSRSETLSVMRGEKPRQDALADRHPKRRNSPNPEDMVDIKSLWRSK